MATEVVSTIRSSGGDYTSLSAWEAGEQGDLVTADEVRVAECYNDWGSGLSDAVTIDGSTTDSTRYMVIRAATGNGHDGTPGTGFFVTSSSAGTATVNCLDLYTQLRGIEARHTQSTVSVRYAIALYNNCAAVNCLATTASSASTSAGIFLTSTSNAEVSQAICCLAYDCTSRGFSSQNRGHLILNCTAADCGSGFVSSGSGVIVKNSVAYNNATNWGGTWSASSTHNATSSASDDAPGASSVTGVSSSDFVDAANNDFHLASGSVLIGAGTNLYSDFTTDIDGDTWPSSGAWDIGFDYYTSSGSNYTQSITGSLVSSGYLIRQTGKRTIGSVSGFGVPIKHTTKSSNGSITNSGVATPSVGAEQSVTGTITLSGVLSDAVNYVRSYASQIVSSGSLNAAFSGLYLQALSGIITASGIVKRHTTRLVQGTLTLSNTLLRRITRSLASTLTGIGSVSAFKFVPTVGGLVNRGMRFMRRFIGRR